MRSAREESYIDELQSKQLAERREKRFILKKKKDIFIQTQNMKSRMPNMFNYQK